MEIQYCTRQILHSCGSYRTLFMPHSLSADDFHLFSSPTLLGTTHLSIAMRANKIILVLAALHFVTSVSFFHN